MILNFSLYFIKIMYAWRSHFEITYHKKSSSLTFMLDSYKLTFKKRQITIILESLSFLETHEEEKQTTFVWLMRSKKNFASSINIFCACLFCPSVSKIYSQFYFLWRKTKKLRLKSEKYSYHDLRNLGKIFLQEIYNKSMSFHV